MINDAEMLNYILQNAEMGVIGVSNVRKSASNRSESVDRVLSEHMLRYGKIYATAGNMLNSMGEELHKVSPMAKTMTALSAKRNLKNDQSSSHIAEMMIKGNTMGVNKIAEHLRNYDRTDPNITLLAKKMLDVEQENMKDMRAFL